MGRDAWIFIIWPVSGQKSNTHQENGQNWTPELSALPVTRENRVSTQAPQLAKNDTSVCNRARELLGNEPLGEPVPRTPGALLCCVALQGSYLTVYADTARYSPSAAGVLRWASHPDSCFGLSYTNMKMGGVPCR